MSTFSSLIEHVFVLMLENRSFDHMLGFSGISGLDAATGQPTTIDGLTGNESNRFGGRTFTVTPNAPDVWDVGPGHNFIDVLEQLCGPGVHYPSGGAYPSINNSGYVSSYAAATGAASPEIAGKVMRCYSPDQVPVLTALAREFVVCDHWFSAMPGPTDPNRFFMHAATSGIFDDSPTTVEIFEAMLHLGGGFEFKNGNIFKLLQSAGVKYRIYSDDHFPVAAELAGVNVLFDIREFEDFAEDLNDPSFDASYIHIEPAYDALGDFKGGNSQHPSGSVAAGEQLIKETYEAIRNSPLWEKSMLIITYDEHGGFYDHVIPPATQGTGERGRTHGFTFEQLGPRVPAVVVSPLIPRNLIEHRPFDHTDIPATLRQLFDLPSLAVREGLSGGVSHLIQLSVPRADAPLKLPDVAGAGLMAALQPLPALKTAPRRPDAPLSDDQHGNIAALLHSAVVQHLQVTPEEQHQAILDRVAQLQTRADVFAYVKEVDRLVQAKRAEAGLVSA